MSLSLLCVSLGCASESKLSEPIRAAVLQRHTGRIVELRQSSYYGDLYDENEKWLLSAHPFADTYHIVDLNGVPIHPKVQRGIVPAGTRFVVETIEFPDRWNMAKRMLTTPRYNPWVYLRVVPHQARIPDNSKLFVIVLPSDLASEEAVEAALTKDLAPEGKVSTWLAARRPTVQAAIKDKQAIAGMTLEELSVSLGAARRWFVENGAAGQQRVAWYPEQEVWLSGDTVSDVKPSRMLPTSRGQATHYDEISAPDGAPDAPATTNGK